MTRTLHQTGRDSKRLRFPRTGLAKPAAWRSVRFACAVLAAVLLVPASWGPPSVSPAAAAAGQRRVALVVGNGDYRFRDDLPNAAADGEAVADILASLGFEVIRRRDAPLAALRAAVAETRNAGAGAGAIVVYYAGHGFVAGGADHLVPVDARLRSRAAIGRETLTLGEVTAALQADGRPLVVFLDMCREGPLPGQAVVATPAAPVARDVFVAYASRAGTMARDGGGAHGPFAAALLADLPTPGLELADLMRRVERSVEAATFGTQVPEARSTLGRPFTFAPAARQGSLRVRRGG